MKKIPMLLSVALMLCITVVAQPTLKNEHTSKLSEIKGKTFQKKTDLQTSLDAFWTYILAMKNCTTDQCKADAIAAVNSVEKFTSFTSDEDKAQIQAFFESKFGVLCGVISAWCSTQLASCGFGFGCYEDWVRCMGSCYTPHF